MASQDDYQLLDSGHGEKLERFTEVVLRRPSPQALWAPSRPAEEWNQAVATYHRSDQGGGSWQGQSALPERWTCTISGIDFGLSATGFGHVGVFPEQKPFWNWIRQSCRHHFEDRGKGLRVLNLFAYTGGSSIAAAQGGAQVTHCDASKGIVRWASDNARACDFEGGSIRWIIDDAMKFLAREARRDSRYDAIILDPPSFGRGPKGEVWKLEESVGELLAACAQILTPRPAFVLLSAHTPGLGPLAFRLLLRRALRDHAASATGGGEWAHGEMFLAGAAGTDPLPSGSWTAWSATEAPSLRPEVPR